MRDSGRRVTAHRGTTAMLLLAMAVGLPAQTVRDSAGVQVVENRAPALSAAKAWRVDPRPTLVIGDPAAMTAGDSLYEFNLIMGVVRLGDGRWAVGVQGAQAIRFYDAGGKFVRSAGRAGRGPGEFQQIMRLNVTRGDSLFVTDLGEVEYFTGRGDFIAQGASRSGGRFIWPYAVFPDRSYAGFDLNRPEVPPAGRALQRLPVYRVSADGARMDSLTTLSAREQVFDGKNRFGREVYFSPTGLLAGVGDRLYYSFPVKAEIAELGRDGRASRLIRLSVPPVAVTSADREANVNRSRDAVGEDGRPLAPAMKARMEQAMKEAVYADAFPVYGLLLGDRVGNLWARRFDLRERFFRSGPVSTITVPAPTRWDVLDARGRWLCTVELPARFTPLEIGNDYVAGVARDNDDVEMVRVFRLIKP